MNQRPNGPHSHKRNLCFAVEKLSPGQGFQKAAFPKHSFDRSSKFQAGSSDKENLSSKAVKVSASDHDFDHDGNNQHSYPRLQLNNYKYSALVFASMKRLGFTSINDDSFWMLKSERVRDVSGLASRHCAMIKARRCQQVLKI